MDMKVYMRYGGCDPHIRVTMAACKNALTKSNNKHSKYIYLKKNSTLLLNNNNNTNNNINNSNNNNNNKN